MPPRSTRSSQAAKAEADAAAAALARSPYAEVGPEARKRQSSKKKRAEGAQETNEPLAVSVLAAAQLGQAPASGDADLAGQLAAALQIVREKERQLQQQEQQLQQLRASPSPSPQLSPQQQARALPAAAAAAAAPAASASRFAKKEPRAQDLREYDGASGAKLDAWLDELGAARDLYHLNGEETVDFAASRLRNAARQWWNTLGPEGKAPLTDGAALAAALRKRFQPVTSERVAREQLRSLKQGSRGINEYIAEFQRWHAQLPDMSGADALFAFESGLSANLAEKLRVQGVTSLADAISLVARVGGLLQASAPLGRGAAANQMDADVGEDSASRLDRMEATLHAITSNAGMGAKTQTQRGYQQERGAGGRGGARGGRGGRFGGRGGGGASFSIPGVPAAVVEQRRAAGQCFRCGSGDHRSMECPSAPTASQSSF